jgi:alkylation response protein AidB-like acyl-CoA dehydrogenase
MSTSFPALFPGMALDAAIRFAQDHAGIRDFSGQDPITEMGWALTLIPEDLGGVGGSLADLGAVVEGLATHGVQLPVVETCAIAPILLQATQEAASQWLPQVCEGLVQATVLTALSRPLCDVGLQARQLDIGWELSGTVRGTDASLPFTHAIVPAQVQGSGEVTLFMLAADRLPKPGPTYRTMEGRRAADYVLQALSVPVAASVGRGAAASGALDRADKAALLLTAVDTVAALAALQQATIAHLKERKQFGVALATFQALRHRVADMYVRYQGVKGLVLQAWADAEVQDPLLDRTLRLAKVQLAETARACAEAAIQMHGGMGVSEEVLATRLAQRLIASEFRYGDRLTHSARLLHDEPRARQADPLQDQHTRRAQWP